MTKIPVPVSGGGNDRLPVPCSVHEQTGDSAQVIPAMLGAVGVALVGLLIVDL